MTDSKDNIWVRLVISAIGIFLFYISVFLVGIVFALQFVMTLLNQAPNPDLQKLSGSLSTYISQVLQYILFLSDEKPAPFNTFFK